MSNTVEQLQVCLNALSQTCGFLVTWRNADDDEQSSGWLRATRRAPLRLDPGLELCCACEWTVREDETKKGS